MVVCFYYEVAVQPKVEQAGSSLAGGPHTGACTADSGGIRKEMLGDLGASGTLVGVPRLL